MNKPSISKKIEELNAQNKMALIPFVITGDPDPELSKEIILSLQESGADIIEMGIPYSDPLADGPVIQFAAQRSLKNGMTLAKAIALHNDIKDDLKIPAIIFTYYNPILSYGTDKFITDIKNAGFKGLIVPDLPVEEASELSKLSRMNDIEFIMLVTPTSDTDRINKIAEYSEGFIYLVSVTGVTGARQALSESLSSFIAQIKACTTKPVCVGFGVSTQEHVSTLKKIGSNGAIVGSALIKKIEANLNNKESMLNSIKEYLKSLSYQC